MQPVPQAALGEFSVKAESAEEAAAKSSSPNFAAPAPDRELAAKKPLLTELIAELTEQTAHSAQLRRSQNLLKAHVSKYPGRDATVQTTQQQHKQHGMNAGGVPTATRQEPAAHGNLPGESPQAVPSGAGAATGAGQAAVSTGPQPDATGTAHSRQNQAQNSTESNTLPSPVKFRLDNVDSLNSNDLSSNQNKLQQRNNVPTAGSHAYSTFVKLRDLESEMESDLKLMDSLAISAGLPSRIDTAIGQRPVHDAVAWNNAAVAGGTAWTGADPQQLPDQAQQGPFSPDEQGVLQVVNNNNMTSTVAVTSVRTPSGKLPSPATTGQQRSSGKQPGWTGMAVGSDSEAGGRAYSSASGSAVGVFPAPARPQNFHNLKKAEDCLSENYDAARQLSSHQSRFPKLSVAPADTKLKEGFTSKSLSEFSMSADSGRNNNGWNQSGLTLSRTLQEEPGTSEPSVSRQHSISNVLNSQHKQSQQSLTGDSKDFNASQVSSIRQRRDVDNSAEQSWDAENLLERFSFGAAGPNDAGIAKNKRYTTAATSSVDSVAAANLVGGPSPVTGGNPQQKAAESVETLPSQPVGGSLESLQSRDSRTKRAGSQEGAFSGLQSAQQSTESELLLSRGSDPSMLGTHYHIGAVASAQSETTAKATAAKETIDELSPSRGPGMVSALVNHFEQQSPKNQTMVNALKYPETGPPGSSKLPIVPEEENEGSAFLTQRSDGELPWATSVDKFGDDGKNVMSARSGAAESDGQVVHYADSNGGSARGLAPVGESVDSYRAALLTEAKALMAATDPAVAKKAAGPARDLESVRSSAAAEEEAAAARDADAVEREQPAPRPATMETEINSKSYSLEREFVEEAVNVSNTQELGEGLYVPPPAKKEPTGGALPLRRDSQEPINAELLKELDNNQASSSDEEEVWGGQRPLGGSQAPAGTVKSNRYTNLNVAGSRERVPVLSLDLMGPDSPDKKRSPESSSSPAAVKKDATAKKKDLSNVVDTFDADIKAMFEVDEVESPSKAVDAKATASPVSSDDESFDLPGLNDRDQAPERRPRRSLRPQPQTYPTRDPAKTVKTEPPALPQPSFSSSETDEALFSTAKSQHQLGINNDTKKKKQLDIPESSVKDEFQAGLLDPSASTTVATTTFGFSYTEDIQAASSSAKRQETPSSPSRGPAAASGDPTMKKTSPPNTGLKPKKKAPPLRLGGGGLSGIGSSTFVSSSLKAEAGLAKYTQNANKGRAGATVSSSLGSLNLGGKYGGSVPSTGEPKSPADAATSRYGGGIINGAKKKSGGAGGSSSQVGGSSGLGSLDFSAGGFPEDR